MRARYTPAPLRTLAPLRGFPWPAFVTLAALFNLLKVATSREQKVAENIRYLERKQAKERYRRGELPPS